MRQQENMHLFNQKYWGKLARKGWLVNGDRHSHYFRHTMKARKSRSKIIKTKDAYGAWMDEPPKFSNCLFITSHHDLNLHTLMRFLLKLSYQ